MGVNYPPIYLLGDTPHQEVIYLPLLEIVYIPFQVHMSDFDALIFTSKNSVKALQKSQYDWKEKASYAIGEATARAVVEAGGNLVYTAKNAYGDTFAHEIMPLLQKHTVFFPRAKEVVSSVFEILQQAGIRIVQEIVYETHCKQYPASDTPPHNAILIFTSPSSVRCFGNNFIWDKSYRLIAIGQKTADALPPNFDVSIPKKQTIEACVALAKQIRS